MQKIIIPVLSALAGATLALSISHSMAKKNPDAAKDKSAASSETLSENIQEEQDQLIRRLFEQQRDMEKGFDSFFNDDFFTGKDPFETMRQFRKRMDQQFQEFGQAGDSPFDSWFSQRFGGGSVDDIKQRSDDKYLYYEITVDDIEATTLNTKIENGMITIEGETRKEFQNQEQGQNQRSQSFMSSRFTRSFPLPTQVDADKMETEHNGNTIILKFPRKAL